MASIRITISELMFELSESTQWIDAIFYTLSAAYSLLSAFALAKGLSTNGLRAWYISVNCAVYVIQILIWLYLWLTDDNFDGLISQLFIAVISFVAALGFLLQGRRLFLLLKRFPLESKGRQKKLFEVGSVTAICVTCFLIRCFIGVVSTFTADASLKVLEHPLLDLMCYMLTEIMPSARGGPEVEQLGSPHRGPYEKWPKFSGKRAQI
ncbi:hypothetical protein RND81_12G199600 [Saponaria officinalis]|uniref:THH1/TOM1/TOM3 domain-containing protein n=1 Tax=Saponaria officinalis TaxID=3572 RepID=A0AAW1HD25_SAPOF